MCNELTERNAAICNAVKAGRTFTSTAKEFGLSIDRVRGIYYRDKRRKETAERYPSHIGVSIRAVSCLVREGCKPPLNPAEISQRFTQKDLMLIPNMGPKSVAEIKSWLESHGHKLRP
jgi:DNA-directed RNA polymerase alpha subunit